MKSTPALNIEFFGIDKAYEYLGELRYIHVPMSKSMFRDQNTFGLAADLGRMELIKMNSVVNGGLSLSLGHQSKLYSDGFMVMWGAKNTTKGGYKMHFLNTGTKPRYTSRGKYTGIVGGARTDYLGRNYLFRTGFADRASETAGLGSIRFMHDTVNYYADFAASEIAAKVYGATQLELFGPSFAPPVII